MQRIKGIAFSGAWYLGTGSIEELDIDDDTPMPIATQLLDIKSQTLFEVFWFPIEIELTMGPQGDPGSPTILVPKASRFRLNVELLT